MSENAGFSIDQDRGLWGGRLMIFHSLPSTNQWALDHPDSCRHGDVVWAQAQTGGRGRFDRPWFARPNRSLAVSIILKPDTPESALEPFLAQASTWAVGSMLDGYSIAARFKWPNDLVAHDRKIAGILVDKHPTCRMLVVGIGLNVNLDASDLAGSLIQTSATSMRMVSQRRFHLPDVLAALLNAFALALDRIRTGGSEVLFDAWRKHDALDGHHIQVQTAGGLIAGQYRGMDSAGRLLLMDPGGALHVFSSGDVSLSPLSGAPNSQDPFLTQP